MLASASSAKGSSGILVTCDRIRERESVKEALNLFNEIADRDFPEPKEEEQAKEGDSVEQQLADEIAALKEDAKHHVTGRFTALDTGVKGVILLQIQDPKISATTLVKTVMTQVEETKEVASRYINRLLPLESIGYASLEDIKKTGAELIQSFLSKYEADEATKDIPIEVARSFVSCTMEN